MDVYGQTIPNRPLSNFDLLRYVKILNIQNFRGVFMKDNLPKKPKEVENGIVNFNRSDQPGSHWVAYYKDGKDRIYFDSFGQTTLHEIQNYLKEPDEGSVIQRNTDVVQPFNSVICGHLCLYVLKSLTSGLSFRDILNKLTLKLGSGIQWTTKMADELHKPIRKKFPKRFVFARHVDDIWGSDLIDLSKLSKKNQGFKYVLMVMDIFSRYGWAIPVRDKTGKTIETALESLFKKKAPKKLWVDRGKEYYNKDVNALLKKYKIEIYSTHNDEKCSSIERWNRTIKGRLWRYFSANGTHKYTDILDALIEKYNTTKHRSLGTTPSDARKPANYQQVFKKLYFDKVQARLKPPKFKIGDPVRISVKKNIFAKGYSQNWSDKIYTVSEVLKTLPTTYRIKDREVLEGTFYEQELQLSKTVEFNIEKILKYKTVEGKKFARIQWRGYDSSHNSWEPVEKIQKL